MEILPVSFDQIVAGRDGREYEVTGQAGGIAKQLLELDPPLHTTFNEGGMFFAVSQHLENPDGTIRSELVGRVPPDSWNQKVVEDFQMRAFELRHGISAAGRLDADDQRRKDDADYALEQACGEGAYPLMRAIQKDFVGINPRVFLSARRKRQTAQAA